MENLTGSHSVSLLSKDAARPGPFAPPIEVIFSEGEPRVGPEPAQRERRLTQKVRQHPRSGRESLESLRAGLDIRIRHGA